MKVIIDGDVNITMTGGKISRINGTGYDYYNTKGGYVNNVNITISGGTVSDDINAGWRNPVKGNVLEKQGAEIIAQVLGDCLGGRHTGKNGVAADVMPRLMHRNQLGEVVDCCLAGAISNL